MSKRKRHTNDSAPGKANFVIGAGSVINLAGNYYSFPRTVGLPGADRMALQNDFNMIGRDFYRSINKLRIKMNNNISMVD